MTETQTRPRFATTLAQLLRGDRWFQPAALLAVLATVFALLLPPAWVSRIPSGVRDIVTGDRQALGERLSRSVEKSRQLERRGETLSTRLGATETARDGLRSDLDKSESALSELRSAQGETAKAIAAGKVLVGQQRARIGALGGELSASRSELAAQTAGRQSAGAALDRQAERLSKLETERDGMRASLRASSEKIAESRYLEFRLADALRERTANRNTIEGQSTTNAALQRDVARQVAELRATRTEIARQTGTIARLDGEREAMTSIVKGQSVQAGEMIRLAGIAAAASKTDAENKRIIQSQNARLESLGQNAVALRGRITDKNEQISRLGARLESQRAERGRRVAALARLEGERAALDGRLAGVLKTAREKQTETVRLEASVRQASAARDASRTELVAERVRHTGALALLEGEKAALDGRLADVMKAAREKATETVRLEASVRQANAAHDASRSELAAERVRRTEALARLEGEKAALDLRLAGALKATQEKATETARLAASVRQANAARDTSRAELAVARGEISVLRTGQAGAQALGRELAAGNQRLAEFEKQVADAKRRGGELRASLALSRSELSAEQQNAARLALRSKAVQGEVMRLLSVLRVSHRKSEKLGKIASAAGVVGGSTANMEGLLRFRSEFFNRLGTMVGDREDVRQVGDRFVFQAEVLFDSGSPELGARGHPQLAQVASSLKDIALDTPPDLNWILRVDGHTDRVPIQTSAFPSNWELSTARAISVVRFLISQGVPPDRLSANGFGEFQPLDDATDAAANRRNRRIELKLTER